MFVLVRKVTAPNGGSNLFCQAIDWQGKKAVWKKPYRQLLTLAEKEIPAGVTIEVLEKLYSTDTLNLGYYTFTLPLREVIDWSVQANQVNYLTPLDLERLEDGIRFGAKPYEIKTLETRTEEYYFFEYNYLLAEDASDRQFLVGETELLEYLRPPVYEKTSVRGEIKLADVLLQLKPRLAVRI